MTLISRKPGPDRITWVCPYSGGLARRVSWVALSEASRPLCAFSHRMISRRRGCPAAMLQSTWRERTSSTLSAGQPGPEANILQSRGSILMGTCELWRLGLAGGELNPYSELLVPSPSPPHSLALLPSQWTLLPIQDASKYLCLFPLQERWTVSLSRDEGFTRRGYRWAPGKEGRKGMCMYLVVFYSPLCFSYD